MSVESLIFLAIFFLLPLLERLLERNRRRRAPTQRPDVDADQDPMLPAPPRRTAPDEPLPQHRESPPARSIPPPLPVPIETRRPDPGPGPITVQKRPTSRIDPQPATVSTTPQEVLQATRMIERARAQIQRTAAANVASTRAPRTATRALNRILRNPRSLRHAVLVAEVLGPCKAQDPGGSL